MRLGKRLFGIFLFTLCITLCAVGISARSVVASGACGTNVTWTYYGDGELMIEGEGAMTSVPWSDYLTYITKVTIKNDVTSIRDYAFQNHSNLRSVTIADSVKTIDIYAFKNCNRLTSITIADGVKTIGDGAFYGCTSLTSVTIPDGVTTIGTYAFQSCSSLTSVIIPDSATTIGKQAFAYCTSLTSVTIPDGVISIGDGAFAYCASDLVIYGRKDSFANIYATINGYTFVALEEAPETEAPETEAADPDVTFTLADITGKPGDTVDVEISVTSNVILNSIALRDLSYDSDILTFEGFADTADIESKCFLTSFDEDNLAIVLALKSDEKLTGKICTLRFTISGEAEDGDTTVRMNSVVKCNSTVFNSAVIPATVTVKSYTTGDINLDEQIDIADALALFRYSMMPDTYPVSYPGDMDFTGDGAIDIADALKLFRYSMMPDVYPL